MFTERGNSASGVENSLLGANICERQMDDTPKITMSYQEGSSDSEMAGHMLRIYWVFVHVVDVVQDGDAWVDCLYLGLGRALSVETGTYWWMEGKCTWLDERLSERQKDGNSGKRQEVTLEVDNNWTAPGFIASACYILNTQGKSITSRLTWVDIDLKTGWHESKSDSVYYNLLNTYTEKIQTKRKWVS